MKSIFQGIKEIQKTYSRQSNSVLPVVLLNCWLFNYLIINPVHADSSAPSITQESELSKIEDITNNIVKKELEMLSLDTKFRIENTRISKAKPWRVFAYKLAASGLTEAGITTVAVSRWKYYQHPQLAPRPLLKAGPICNLTAASIVIGGTLLEGIFNRLNDYKLKQDGVDAKTALKQFLNIRSEVDRLLTKREALAKTIDLANTCMQVINADGVVLRDIRDLTSIQFADYYVRNKQTLITRDAGTMLSLAGAGTGGFIGSLNSLLAVNNHNPRQGGLAGIGFIISGSIVALTPLMVRAAGEIATHRMNQKIEKLVCDLHTKTMESFETDRQNLLKLIETTDGSDLTVLNGLAARTSTYDLQKAIFENQNIIARKRIDKQNNNLKERLFFSSVVGGTNLARGVILTIAGFKYSSNPTTAFKLTAIASTTYMVGAGMWILDTLQDRIRAEALSQKVTVARLSTQDQLLQRLQNIEEQEEVINLY